MKKTFQIRREPFGVALVAAESAKEALVEFVSTVAAGEIRPSVKVNEDGSAEVEYDGIVYRAVA